MFYDIKRQQTSNKIGSTNIWIRQTQLYFYNFATSLTSDSWYICLENAMPWPSCMFINYFCVKENLLMNLKKNKKKVEVANVTFLFGYESMVSTHIYIALIYK